MNVRETYFDLPLADEGRGGSGREALHSAEIRLLREFFLLLDEWDRELVQNAGDEIEVSPCKAQ